MSDQGAAVALLFDDAELGGHLRTALSERGARIVHEGPLGTFDRALLLKVGADVLVVNLDDDADDDALDHLYGLAEAANARVVFNDAEASRGLDGWDRARWARHLAVKALAVGDFDPPRPTPSLDATPVDVEGTTLDELGPPALPVIDVDDNAFSDASMSFDPSNDIDTEQAAVDSETLAAELEALLAAGDESETFDDQFGSGLKFDADVEPPPLHDGNFADVEAVPPATEETQAPSTTLPPDLPPQPSVKREFNLDHLALAPISEHDEPIPFDASAISATSVHSPTAPEWDLLSDNDDAGDEDHAVPTAENFGIEKLSAADFLAPPAGDDSESPILPGLTLELVSNEEFLAPRDYDQEAHEVRLDELENALGRMLVLGAARDSFASVCAFLSTLPVTLRLPILLTQHLGDQSAEQLAEALSAHSSLPVRVAAPDARAKIGVVLLVPRGQQVRVKRDGQLELSAIGADAAVQPSIDSSFTMVANVFGRDALAIVFAGQATDGVAGAQAIHDRGGRVWVESSPGDHYTDMVHGVMAERLTSFSGSPRELATRLIEDYR